MDHRGQSERIARAIKQWTPAVRRALSRLGMHDADIDDGVQGVLSIFVRRIRDVADGSEAAFLVETARRTAADYRRQLRRRREDAFDVIEVADSPRSSDSPEALLQASQRLSRLLEKIPEPRRVVFALFVLEGLTLQEIAEDLRLPYGTVASRLHRARRDLDASKKRPPSRLRGSG